MKSRRSKNNTIKSNVALFVLIEVFLIVIIFIAYRPIRVLFPKFFVGGVVGYAQYFGYPLYFDNFVFLIIILSPILAFLIKRVVKRMYKKV